MCECQPTFLVYLDKECGFGLRKSILQCGSLSTPAPIAAKAAQMQHQSRKAAFAFRLFICIDIATIGAGVNTLIRPPVENFFSARLL